MEHTCRVWPTINAGESLVHCLGECESAHISMYLFVHSQKSEDSAPTFRELVEQVIQQLVSGIHVDLIL